MSRFLTVVALLLVAAAALCFAALNGTQRVTLNLGFVILYYVPVTLVAFGGILLGMLLMFAAGIRSDLKVRRILRDRFEVEEGRAARPLASPMPPVTSPAEIRSRAEPPPAGPAPPSSGEGG